MVFLVRSGLHILKFHQHLIEACAQALEDIFVEGRHADKCIEFCLKRNRRWGSRDRRFFAETVYDCVRWYRFYQALLGSKSTGMNLQVVEVSLWKNHGYIPEKALWRPEDLERNQSRLKTLAELQSFPDWWEERFRTELGDFGAELLVHLNKPNFLVVRTNTQKITRDELIKKFTAEDYSVLPLDGTLEGILFTERVNIFASPLFKEGYFEVQDGSSQQVADFADPKPGERVIDACAGAGGKSLHLAGRMNNKGKIFSLDIHQWKLDALKIRARRNSHFNIETRAIEGSKTIKRLQASADLLLLDVPCSGSGVLRRNPDTKWKLDQARLEELISLQKTILRDYCGMLKPGGRLLYSTCSLLPSENQNQVRDFLSEHPEYQLVKQRTIYPNRDGYDGFFMALMVKNK